MPFKYIKELVEYGIRKGLMKEADRVYVTNRILDLISFDEYREPEDADGDAPLEDILGGLLTYACDEGLIEDTVTDRDLWDTRLMDQLLPRPSEVIARFGELYRESPKKARIQIISAHTG